MLRNFFWGAPVARKIKWGGPGQPPGLPMLMTTTAHAQIPAGYAPRYLKNSIKSRSVSARYSLRVNDDNWLLQTVTRFNFARFESIFSYASLNVWNSLPLSLREIETLFVFKKRQKAHYFNLAFEDIATVWCQYFTTYSAVELVARLCINFILVKLFE